MSTLSRKYKQLKNRLTSLAHDDRGDVVEKVFVIVGMVILAVAVIAAITAFVNGQLDQLPG
ncbi:hypothetical protein [Agrococcus casei]|uniref:Uncharacterized protein n=1 Tax=Agrococcus casei LMG 22410 TaxID=1255656 RepID=A0A1R4FJ27_9MICO|nr:hypothetical protein [Agrococcus casei]SJM55879.1 hypothetical protein CZ674_04750 [Agrococcus casei LMG 22410]